MRMLVLSLFWATAIGGAVGIALYIAAACGHKPVRSRYVTNRRFRMVVNNVVRIVFFFGLSLCLFYGIYEYITWWSVCRCNLD